MSGVMIVYDVSVRPDWLTTMFENAASVATCRPYEDARDAVLHLNCARIGIPVVALAGLTSAGAEGAAMIVVKFHGADHELVPPAFVAFILQ